MGIVIARLQLNNPRKPSPVPTEVEALADMGSVYVNPASPNIASGICMRAA